MTQRTGTATIARSRMDSLPSKTDRSDHVRLFYAQEHPVQHATHVTLTAWSQFLSQI